MKATQRIKMGSRWRERTPKSNLANYQRALKKMNFASLAVHDYLDSHSASLSYEDIPSCTESLFIYEKTRYFDVRVRNDRANFCIVSFVSSLVCTC